jgi:hypothetical protein
MAHQADRATRKVATIVARTITPSAFASSSERGFMLNHQLVESYPSRPGDAYFFEGVACFLVGWPRLPFEKEKMYRHLLLSFANE